MCCAYTYLARRPILTGYMLLKTYINMRDIGLTRCKRDFSTRWLGRGKTYLRDFEFRDGRDGVKVPTITVIKLRSRLQAVADRVPAGIRSEIELVIKSIDEG